MDFIFQPHAQKCVIEAIYHPEYDLAITPFASRNVVPPRKASGIVCTSDHTGWPRTSVSVRIPRSFL